MHHTILEMLRTPGKYTVSTPSGAARGAYITVVVDQDLVCYQLTPAGERLSTALHPDSWSPLAQVYQQADNGGVAT